MNAALDGHLEGVDVDREVEVDVSHIPIANGDLFLICSDGLSGLVTDDEMLALVNAGVSGQKALRQICEDLVNQANAAGGHDNITVQLLRINATDSATTEKREPMRVPKRERDVLLD